MNFWHAIHIASSLLDVDEDGDVYITNREEWDALWLTIHNMGATELAKALIEAKAARMAADAQP